MGDNVLRLMTAICDGLNYDGFTTALLSFQINVTECWRGKRSICDAMIMPVLVENELTQKGSSKVILGLLSLFGIIKLNNSESSNFNNNIHDNNLTVNDKTSTTKKNIFNGVQLCDGYKNKKLFIVGDGFSQSRLMSFWLLLEKETLNYNNRCDAMHVAKLAME